MALNKSIYRLIRLSSTIRGLATRNRTPSFLDEEQRDAPSSIQKLENMYKINHLRPEQSTSYVTGKPEFEALTRSLKVDINLLTEGKLIQAFKCLNYFKVSSSSEIVEQLLHRINQRMDYLSLDQIAYLHILLRKSYKTPLVWHLLDKIPVIFQTRVHTNFDIKDFETFINVLEYVRKTPDTYSIIPKFTQKLNKFNLSALSPDNARELLFIYLDIPVVHLEPVISKIINIVADSTDILDSSEVLAMINRIMKKTIQKQSNYEVFFNENLIDNIINSLISKDMGYDVAIKVLSDITQISHANHALIDYIASKYDEDISLFEDADYHVVQDVVKALALTNYKPAIWDEIKEHLFRKEILNEPYVLLLQLGIDFVVLDCYWPELLEKIFDVGFIGDPRIPKNYLFLYEIVKARCPEYHDILPNDEVINSYKQFVSSDDLEQSLKLALETITGGEQYIASNVKTNLGFLIDHVMIRKNDGSPIAINNAEEPFPKTIEDLKPIPDSEVILFMYVPLNGYFEKLQQPSAFWLLLMKELEARTKHTVIPIYSKAWMKLSQEEQVQYLSNTLKPESDKSSATIST
ncbi:hypothetical protein HCN44_005149 [Aphidius gifuensis]|uniref:FAST kinase-like protein subdomain 2 domain-containing protein n=1 Tax=Aphidius gifuensis TaxID=684658 RepID=A0A834XSU2_APHGI|nr:uncharacterized protein LOC122852393 [Aphidius gifuensis]KAF7992805.1 hypothetical protein HCN44_005149 [Aphidius gifuensis]